MRYPDRNTTKQSSPTKKLLRGLLLYIAVPVLSVPLGIVLMVLLIAGTIWLADRNALYVMYALIIVILVGGPGLIIWRIWAENFSKK